MPSPQLSQIMRRKPIAPLVAGVAILAGLVRLLRREREKTRLLRLNEERFRAMFDNTAVGIAEVAENDRIVAVNQRACSMLGYRADELLEMSIHDLTAPEDRNLTDTLNRQLHGGVLDRTAYDKRYLKGDGSRLWVHVTVSAVRDENGRWLRSIGTIEDISERKSAQEERRRQREEFQRVAAEKEQTLGMLNALVMHAPVGFAFFDREHRYTLINDFLCRINGLPCEAHLGRTVAEVLPESAGSVDPLLDRIFETGEALENVEVAGETPLRPGELRHWLTGWFPVIQPAGQEPLAGAVVLEITEMKHIQRALQESEGRQRLFIEHAPVSLAMFDREMRYMSASRRWNRDFFDKDDFDPIGRSHYDLFPDMPQRWRDAHRRGLAGDVIRMEEDCFERTDGSLQWLRWEVRPWQEFDGSIGGIIIFTEDITGRKEVEEALRESEGKFRRTYENAAVGITLLDHDGRFMQANDKFCEILGYSEEELRGHFFGRFAPLDDIEPDSRQYALLMNGDLPSYALERRYIRKDGNHVWVRITRSALLDQKGHPAYGISIVEDITDRKQTENALRHNEELLRKVLETLPVGVWIMDATGVIIQGNNAALDIWRGARFVGVDQFGEYKGWRLPSREPVASSEWAAARAMTRGETTIGEEIEIECFDGSHKIILNSAVPLRDENGEIAGAIVVNQDITRRKQAEEALRKAKDELEMRVVERTRELSRTLDDLRHQTEERFLAVEELRRNEQILVQQGRLAVMGEMLGNIAHQWRQPLNVLGLLLQGLPLIYEQGTLTRESLEESVARGWELIAHMSQTIEDFRGFLSPEKTKATFSLRAIVEKGISLVREGLKNVRVSVEVHEDVTVEGFQNEFAQVVMNILINARDAFRERNIQEPRITVAIFGDHGKGVVTIADNAGGIPPGIIDRIFDPYFTTKPPDKGTGIGLFMSKTIIEKNMGGRLTVRNTEEGAEFRIEV